MTVPMTVVENIRRLDADGVSARQIAIELGVSRDSVAKYTSIEDYSPTPPRPAARPGAQSLEGFTEVIDAWLVDDARRPRKQRHTARRVFDRLVTEHDYAGSYSPVQRYIKAYKAAHRARGEGFQQLVWPPGTAQVDFGEAQALIAGVKMLLHILVVTFPFSNMRFVQAYRGETAECVAHGLRTIFEHINAAPRQLIFDNATGIGRRTGTKVIESKLFGSFKAHYRCQGRYCNPYSGHEKGNVENAVGFLRRNIMVPEPEAQSIEGLNQMLLARCAQLAEEDHYRKGAPIVELFGEDVAACLELPGIGFDPVRYESRRADKTGAVLVESNTYLAGPAFHDRLLTVGIRHDRIEILDEHCAPVVVFDRVYGKAEATILAPGSLLPALVAKPGAWGNSPVRTLVADPVRDWLDAAAHADRARLLTHMDQAATATDFDTAIEAAEKLITVGDDPASAGLGMLARRIVQGAEPATAVVDLGVYDQLTGITNTIEESAAAQQVIIEEVSTEEVSTGQVAVEEAA